MTATVRRPAVIGAVIAVVLVLGWWRLLWNPQATALAAAHQQEQQQTTNLLVAGQTLGHLKHLHTISTRMAALEQQITAAVPAGDGLDQFLLSLNALAQADGISVVSVSPGQPSALAGLTSIPVDLSLTGTYADLQRFLDGLRNGNRLVLVDSLTEAPSTVAHGTGDIAATVAIHILSGLHPGGQR